VHLIQLHCVLAAAYTQTVYSVCTLIMTSVDHQVVVPLDNSKHLTCAASAAAGRDSVLRYHDPLLVRPQSCTLTGHYLQTEHSSSIQNSSSTSRFAALC
jgi:hypothetical protein